jgi:hypothetical protein
MKTLYTAINNERTWQDFLRRDKAGLAGGMIFPGRNPFLIQKEHDSVYTYENRNSALHVARLHGFGNEMVALRIDIPDDAFDHLVADNLITKVGSEGVWKMKTVAFFDPRLANATARVDSDA